MIARVLPLFRQLVFTCHAIMVCLGVLNFDVAGQNLVPNPSFEEVSTSSAHGSISNVFTSYNGFMNPFNWYRPTLGTTDAFHHVWKQWGLGTKYNRPSSGNRFPRTGEGMIGMITKSDSRRTYTEVIQCELIDTLEKDSLYYLEYWVIPARWIGLHTDGFCADVSKERIWDPTTSADLAFKDVVPEVMSFGVPVSDTTNWTKISGCFIAEGGEKFLTIGCIHNITGRTIVRDPRSTIDDRYERNLRDSYYYVDDVLLEKRSYHGKAPFEILEDVELCAGDSIEFTLPEGLDGYQWSNGGQKHSNFMQSDDSASWGAAYEAGCEFKFEFNVIEIPAFPEEMFEDLSLCDPDDMILIEPDCDDCSVIWWDSSTFQFAQISAGGWYGAEVSNECFTEVYEFFVSDEICEPNRPQIFEPNVVTPDGDGMNDVLDFGYERGYDFELRIYNRWGNVIFRKDNYQNDYSPVDLQEGTYFYILTSENYSISTNGSFLLLK